MNHPQHIILFHSNFSQNCIKFRGMLEQLNLKCQYVSIDNKHIRNIITQSENINIQYVPCILIINFNGVVEKYEATDAFIWIQNMIQMISPQQQPLSQHSSQQPSEEAYDEVEETKIEFNEPLPKEKPKPKSKRDKKVKFEIPETSDNDENEDKEEIRGITKANIMAHALKMSKEREDDTTNLHPKPIGRQE